VTDYLDGRLRRRNRYGRGEATATASPPRQRAGQEQQRQRPEPQLRFFGWDDPFAVVKVIGHARSFAAAAEFTLMEPRSFDEVMRGPIQALR